MLLHGTYDNGKITIKEKKIPKIKTEIEIEIKESKKIKGKNKSLAGIFHKYSNIKLIDKESEIAFKKAIAEKYEIH